MKLTMLTQTHDLDVTSCHPSTSSETKLACSPGSRSSGTRTLARNAALAAKLSASTARAQPDPTVAMRRAAIAGPPMPIVFPVRERSALACCRRPGLTAWGVSPVAAGSKNAPATPLKA